MDKIKEEAHKRLTAKAGEAYVFPRGSLTLDRPPHEGHIANYQQHLYGDKELGGTQVIYLSAVPFAKLGLPTNVPDYGYPAISEGIQHTIYKWLAAPLIVLAGLLFAVRRNTKADTHQSHEGDKS